MILKVLSKVQNYILLFIYTVDEKYQANQRGCHLSEKNPEDSKCFALNFINLNDKKIYNKLRHMSCCLIQTFRPSGFLSVFTKSKPGQKIHNLEQLSLYFRGENKVT